MRLLLASTLIAGAALAATPASAYLLSTGCQTGDWQVIEVSSGGSEVVEICTNAVKKPVVTVTYCRLLGTC